MPPALRHKKSSAARQKAPRLCLKLGLLEVPAACFEGTPQPSGGGTKPSCSPLPPPMLRPLGTPSCQPDSYLSRPWTPSSFQASRGPDDCLARVWFSSWRCMYAPDEPLWPPLPQASAILVSASRGPPRAGAQGPRSPRERPANSGDSDLVFGNCNLSLLTPSAC